MDAMLLFTFALYELQDEESSSLFGNGKHILKGILSNLHYSKSTNFKQAINVHDPDKSITCYSFKHLGWCEDNHH